MSLNDYIINNTTSLKLALKKLNRLENNFTLFVIDKNKKIIGTLTDGDIRRGLIKGLKVEDSVDKFAFKKFRYLKQGEVGTAKIKNFKKLKIKIVPLVNSNNQLIKLYNFAEIKTVLPLDAVIMAGGKGERLLPLTANTPKPLLKVGNKPIINYNISRLYKYGIENQFITINYLGDQIKKYCNAQFKKINFSYVEEKKALGTIGAVKLISKFTNDYVLIMNSDLLTNIDYEDFFKTFIDHNADMIVASVPYSVSMPYAIIESNNAKVISFKEKPKYTYFANAGIYIVKRQLIKLIPKNKHFNATDLMELVIKQKLNLVHYPILSYWMDIGKHEDFEKAQKDISHIDFD